MSVANELVTRYFHALNERDARACLALLSDDVCLDLNQGMREEGRQAFAAYLARNQRCYRESFDNLVILGEPSGRHAACEFTLSGEYLATDDGLPDACGQSYQLQAATFFEIRDGLICRVSQHFNLPEWLAQVDF
ncbi:nuclear transport factor 2 family protein [Pseudomonas sp. GD03944]|uniref:nuclear transport factor 2 family protein n=1 Tax=Pseudomonas sp. GD03944 TaxID=2975409 RepID=UPI002448B703|nr:nuclear transport factor 2 family protein [Pseudomonas sp. GD03944]MDH1265553.1 nuclear transport factor 2 family protein [Pseudomonas sp. GD03944]